MSTQVSSLYQVLHVEAASSPEDIRKAFKKRALETQYPSDPSSVSEEEKKVNRQRLREVYAAFEILSDPVKRRAYDDKMRTGDNASSPSPPPPGLDDHLPSSPQLADEQQQRCKRDREALARRREERRQERLLHAQRETIRMRLASAGPLLDLAENMDDVWRKISGVQPQHELDGSTSASDDSSDYPRAL